MARTVKLYEELLVTRPDQQRIKEHGHWTRRTEKWGALLEQLAELVRPADDTEPTVRRWLSLVAQVTGRQTDE